MLESSKPELNLDILIFNFEYSDLNPDLLNILNFSFINIYSLYTYLYIKLVLKYFILIIFNLGSILRILVF